jgi:hypothetical protein
MCRRHQQGASTLEHWQLGRCAVFGTLEPRRAIPSARLGWTHLFPGGQEVHTRCRLPFLRHTHPCA